MLVCFVSLLVTFNLKSKYSYWQNWRLINTRFRSASVKSCHASYNLPLWQMQPLPKIWRDGIWSSPNFFRNSLVTNFMLIYEWYALPFSLGHPLLRLFFFSAILLSPSNSFLSFWPPSFLPLLLWSSSFPAPCVACSRHLQATRNNISSFNLLQAPCLLIYVTYRVNL